jgi:alkylated DNA nucleotide flippase Atl1
MSNKHPMFVRSVESVKVQAFLQKLKVGETATYEDLSRLAGTSDMPRLRGIVGTAIRAIEREDKITFGCVHKVGYQKLDSAGVVGQSTGKLVRLRRLCGRQDKRLGTLVKYADLRTQDDRVQYLANRTIFHFAEEALRPKVIERIGHAVDSRGKALTFDNTLVLLNSIESIKKEA